MPKFRITTPEQVAFHYTIAGLTTRCMAWLVDQAIIWVGYIVIVFIFMQVGGSFAIALVLLGIFVLDFSYFVSFELRWNGQSPGKRLFGIRVISARGTKLRFADVLIRNLMRPIDMLPFGMLTGGATAFLTQWNRRLGDVAADTILIRDVVRVLPQSLATEKGRVNSFQTDPGIRGRAMNRISRDERDLILDLSIRRDQIDPAIREELFAQAAAYFRERLALPPDLYHLSDEQTVVNLALLLQDAKFAA